jgi:hypothetical protein
LYARFQQPLVEQVSFGVFEQVFRVLFELQCFSHQQYQHAYSQGIFAFLMGLGAQQANDPLAAWAP